MGIHREGLGGCRAIEQKALWVPTSTPPSTPGVCEGLAGLGGSTQLAAGPYASWRGQHVPDPIPQHQAHSHVLRGAWVGPTCAGKDGIKPAVLIWGVCGYRASGRARPNPFSWVYNVLRQLTTKNKTAILREIGFAGPWRRDPSTAHWPGSNAPSPLVGPGLAHCPPTLDLQNSGLGKDIRGGPCPGEMPASSPLAHRLAPPLLRCGPGPARNSDGGGR